MEVCQGRQARARSVLPFAKATFRKDRRLNIRLSSKDLEAIQILLHKFASGRLKEL